MQKILDVIRRGRTFLVVAHARPDGDSIGSMLALYHMLKIAGKEPLVYSQDAIPENYRFLPGSDEVVFDLPVGVMTPFSFSIAANWTVSETIGRKSAKPAPSSISTIIFPTIGSLKFISSTPMPVRLPSCSIGWPGLWSGICPRTPPIAYIRGF
jgi:phosphoesterase RecJ-like protein